MVASSVGAELGDSGMPPAPYAGGERDAREDGRKQASDDPFVSLKPSRAADTNRTTTVRGTTGF